MEWTYLESEATRQGPEMQLGKARGRKGLIFVWGMGWHTGTQGTRTLCPAVARLTRLISASLLSCRALSKPNAFPPAGDKEAAGKRGDLPGHAPPPSSRACRAAPRAQVTTRGRRARDSAWRAGAYLGTCC